MGSSTWVLALALGLFAVHTVSATNYTLGSSSGWTNKANIDYTAELAAFKIKVGDTLLFNNNDAINHSVLLLPTQLAYDTCNYTSATSGVILPPNYFLPITFTKPHVLLYVICGFHCFDGQKVMFTVAKADGSPAPGAAPTPSPTGSTAPSPSSMLAPPPPPITLTPSPASTPASAPGPTTLYSPPPPTLASPPPPTTASSPASTTTSTPPPPPAPPSTNVTTPNPFGIVRGGAAGIARFGWLTIAIVCALLCYTL